MLRYVEPLSDARTPLADFFSILLILDRILSVGYTSLYRETVESEPDK